MPDSLPDHSRKRGRTLVLRISLSTALVFLGCVVVVWNVGHVANRQWNQDRESSVQRLPSADGIDEYSICVVELDDQGVLWDQRQLEWTLEHLEATMDSAAAGTLVYVFVHGWKQDAASHDDPRSRLALFHRDVKRIAARAGTMPGPVPSVVGVYIGWRGRSFKLPVLENLTFWNRRVAASRTASVDLLEVLLKIGHLAARDRNSKIVVMGHSLGGAVVERSLAPVMVSAAVAAGASRAIPVLFDLVVLANPASSALDAERLVGFFERNHVRLVVVNPDGSRRLASGPLMVSINADGDLVNRVSYPVGMWFNSLVLRFRDDHPAGAPSQRRLATHAAGHEASLISYQARVAGNGAIELVPLTRAADGAPYWVIRVPDEVSAGHSDVTGALFGDLIGDLMERNQVFDPEAELALVVDPVTP